MMLDPEHRETHTWGKMLKSTKRELILTLVGRVEIEHFISGMTRKSNILKSKWKCAVKVTYTLVQCLIY
jgi:hypothetical protein